MQWRKCHKNSLFEVIHSHVFRDGVAVVPRRLDLVDGFLESWVREWS